MIEKMTTYQEEKRTESTLRALRAYKTDLDQAIAAFSAYAVTHQKRNGAIEPSRCEGKPAAKRHWVH